MKKSRWIPLKEAQKLWFKANGKCSICKISLIKEFEKSEFINLGNRAHIIPHSDNNFRAIIDKKPDNTYENLILLCPTHHTIVDKASKDYPRELLIKIKQDHETSMLENESGFKLQIIPGFSRHVRMNKIIPKIIRNLFRDGYGYFSIDLFVDNLGCKKYNKIKLEITSQSNKLPARMSISTYPITKSSTSFSTSIDFSVNHVNNGEEIVEYNLFYLNYWEYESIDFVKQLIKEIEFDYYLTADDSTPNKGKLKLAIK